MATREMIQKHNNQIRLKKEVIRRERMRLRPLDKNYGQRYFMYDRSKYNQCHCGLPAAIVVNGQPVCSGHINGSLCGQ